MILLLQFLKLSEYPNLRILKCNGNQITELPEYPNLQQCDIYYMLDDKYKDYDENLEDSNRGDECPICYNKMRYNIKFNCNHQICLKCYNEFYIQRQNERICPYCRVSIESDKIA